MNTFWRVPYLDENDELTKMFQQSALVADPGLFAKIKPRHGLVLSQWDNSLQLGKVAALGIVRSVNVPGYSANILWREAAITLKPNPSGRVYWRDKPYFKFAKEVSIRYMLDALFAEHFPEIDSIVFEQTPRQSMLSQQTLYHAIPGYVYLIESKYGYKIGKSVNIKSRTNLFSVKLPFPIKLLHYAWFEDYSQAERNFHDQYFDKRLEGEWFALDPEDILEIKSRGKMVPVDGL